MRNYRRYSAPGRVYHVDTGGNDANSGAADKPLATIAAVNALTLRAGDRVLFQRGQTFAGALLPSAASSGKPGRPIQFGAYGSGAAPIISPAAGIALTFNAGAHDFAFTGLSFIGAANPAFQVAAGVNPSRLTFLACIFNQTGTAKDSFTIDGVSRLIMHGCEFLHAGGTGLSGCVLTNATGVRLVDCLSHHNGTSATTHHGYLLTTCTDVQLTGCASYNNSAHGIYAVTNTALCLIDRCTVYSNGGVGVRFATLAAAGNVLRNSLVYLNTNYGVSFGVDALGITAVHNTIVNNATNGTLDNVVFVSGTTGHVFKNNICVYDNTVCGGIRYALDIANAAIVANNTLDYNAYYRFNGAQQPQGVGATGTSLANWRIQTGTPDLNSVNADPLFVTAYTDLHLQEGSPCAGTGEALGMAADYDQGQRYTPVSMGAYAATSTYEAGTDMILVDDAGLILIDDAGLIWTGGLP